MGKAWKRNQKILIHSGTGGLGQAAIQVALFYNCTIFTTVGTPEKRNYIKKLFPSIQDSHIGSSRDTSFLQMVQSETQGQGVDIVLNSLTGELLKTSIKCLAIGGKLFEFGKVDASTYNQLEIELLNKNISIYGVMMDCITVNLLAREKLMLIFKEHLDNGCIQPLDYKAFEANDIAEAFTHMSRGNHVGKVVIKIRDELEMEPKISGTPRYYPTSTGVIIIMGGLGGFGLELADWLIVRGARKLILTSREGLINGYQAFRMQKFNSHGAQIKIVCDEIKNQEQCNGFLNNANQFGSVEAIFNLTLQLQNGLFENQTIENFELAFEGKAKVTTFLDVGSRQMCLNLKKFVVFSSIISGRGSEGQSNYGMSNSVMERICERRKQDGYHALSIQWGTIGDVGYVNRMFGDQKIVIAGSLPQPIASALETLDQLLSQNETVVSSIVVPELLNVSEKKCAIVDIIAKALGICDIKTVSFTTTLSELGVDSLMIVDIKQNLEKLFNVLLSPKEIRALTIEKLQEMSNRQTLFAGSASPKTQRFPTPDSTGDIRYLRFIDPNTRSLIPILPLHGLSGDIKNIPTVYFLPSIVGTAKYIEPIAAKLKMKSLCVQYVYDENKTQSVEDISADVFSHIIKVLPKDHNFNLVAYGYGCIIACSLLQELESVDYRAKVVFIDGSYDYISRMLLEHYYAGDDNELQLHLLVLALTDYGGFKDTDKFKEHLSQINNFQDRVEYVLSVIPKDISQDYFKKVCYTVYYRFRAVSKFVPNSKNIKSPLSLLKATTPAVDRMEDDYGLRNYFDNIESIKFLKGDHHTLLNDDNLITELHNIFNG